MFIQGCVFIKPLKYWWTGLLVEVFELVGGGVRSSGHSHNRYCVRARMPFFVCMSLPLSRPEPWYLDPGIFSLLLGRKSFENNFFNISRVSINSLVRVQCYRIFNTPVRENLQFELRDTAITVYPVFAGYTYPSITG